MSDKKKRDKVTEETAAEETKGTAEAAAEETTAPETAAETAPVEGAKATDAAADYAALNDKYLRVCAEYDNFRRRSQKEKESLYGDIKADALSKFLPVYDNLERALKQETADEAYRKGVEMIMTQFNATMEKLGVSEIEALGEKFDPEKHNAVMHVDDEAYGENEVVEVFQKGFRMNDKIIRFAMVKVAN